MVSSMAENHDVPAPELIDRYISGFDDWRGRRLARIRELIHEADPAVEETFKWRGNPVWEHDGIICVAGAFKSKVKITFHSGAFLEDPKQVFNNGLDGNKWRAIDLTEDHALDEQAFKGLIVAAVAHNTAK